MGLVRPKFECPSSFLKYLIHFLGIDLLVWFFADHLFLAISIGIYFHSFALFCFFCLLVTSAIDRSQRLLMR